MAIRIVRLGSPRTEGEGLRLGTVRWLPRGVPKAEYARRDLFDVWLPNLAPSAELLRTARSLPGAGAWKVFQRRFRAEMKAPDTAHLLDLLAALSHGTDFSVGCYCAEEAHCHRSLLRELFRARSAAMAD